MSEHQDRGGPPEEIDFRPIRSREAGKLIAAQSTLINLAGKHFILPKLSAYSIRGYAIYAAKIGDLLLGPNDEPLLLPDHYAARGYINRYYNSGKMAAEEEQS